jgi:hypothetical protein
MNKLNKWIFKSKVDLSKKWWHRLFKVIFIILIILSSIGLLSLTISSYDRTVNQWTYVHDFYTVLNSPLYANKVLSIKELYKDNEVISEKYSYEMDFNLSSKNYLEPFSPIFLEDSVSFCSNNLSTEIKNIAYKNNIKLFSTTNPSPQQLYSDIDIFSKYLKNNSFNIGCVMLDSYTLDNDDGTSLKFNFLRPVDTSNYKIYEYKNNISGFALLIVGSLFFLWLCTLCVMIIYYKVILYIVYGKQEGHSK